MGTTFPVALCACVRVCVCVCVCVPLCVWWERAKAGWHWKKWKLPCSFRIWKQVNKLSIMPEMANICQLQLLKCEDLLLSFVTSDSKWRLSVGRKKQCEEVTLGNSDEHILTHYKLNNSSAYRENLSDRSIMKIIFNWNLFQSLYRDRSYTSAIGRSYVCCC